jgi:hypothetical protein
MMTTRRKKKRELTDPQGQNSRRKRAPGSTAMPGVFLFCDPPLSDRGKTGLDAPVSQSWFLYGSPTRTGVTNASVIPALCPCAIEGKRDRMHS